MKVRSYVDHKARAGTTFRSVLGKTYISHWPALTDMARPLLKKPAGYVDHFAQPGDLKTM